MSLNKSPTFELEFFPIDCKALSSGIPELINEDICLVATATSLRVIFLPLVCFDVSLILRRSKFFDFI